MPNKQSRYQTTPHESAERIAPLPSSHGGQEETGRESDGYVMAMLESDYGIALQVTLVDHLHTRIRAFVVNPPAMTPEQPQLRRVRIVDGIVGEAVV